MGDIAVRAVDLSKKYYIGRPQEKYKTLRDTLTDSVAAPFQRARRLLRGEATGAAGLHEELWALKDVSFEIKHGDVVGIIGRNGAGKSTLLKILSRITEPTQGFVDIYGRVGSLLEVGTGFHPELTGRENIYLNGAILGMSRSEINRKFDEIVDFAEVERFIDTPVKHYSSGMGLRLGFAVAAHLEPEILVVDEVLAVGDAAFQKKCLGKMSDVAGEGRTVLFVSHNMGAVENLCHRGITLNLGNVICVGTQVEAIQSYVNILQQNAARDLLTRKDREGNGAIRIIRAEVRDTNGNSITEILSGQDIDLYLYFDAKPDFEDSKILVGVAVKTQWDSPVFLQHNRLTKQEFGNLRGKSAFVLRIPRLPLPPGNYRLGFSIVHHGAYFDRVPDAMDINVVAGDFFGSGEVPTLSHGVCLVDGSWRVE